ncbi:hypothetical protein CHRY9393_01016 [Chryseobacterium fistulae]|uniref:Uncharacterized protein n=1 Tax=Chryseobacterium fistulae TaxID=2675058 RepID=A0A6N4XRE9_9FLAO|nr:hypothetical protein CHRY9393_01016 [Chryseobacterium fistulae]
MAIIYFELKSLVSKDLVRIICMKIDIELQG